MVIPAHNAELTIARAIESASSVGAAEIVVVDDGSTDDTPTVAAEFECLVISQENAGAAVARMRGLEAVRSDYVVFLDADDELIGDFLGEFVEVMERRGDVVGVYGRYRARNSISRSSKLAGSFHPSIDKEKLLRNGFAPCPPGAVIWRREVVESAAGWSLPNLDLRFAEDFELLVRGAAFGPLIGLDRELCVYALGGRTAGRERDEEGDLARVRSYYGSYFGIRVPTIKANSRIARRLLRSGRDLQGAGYRVTGALVLMAGRLLTPLQLLRKTNGRWREGLWTPARAESRE